MRSQLKIKNENIYLLPELNHGSIEPKGSVLKMSYADPLFSKKNWEDITITIFRRLGSIFQFPTECWDILQVKTIYLGEKLIPKDYKKLDRHVNKFFISTYQKIGQLNRSTRANQLVALGNFLKIQNIENCIWKWNSLFSLSWEVNMPLTLTNIIIS